MMFFNGNKAGGKQQHTIFGAWINFIVVGNNLIEARLEGIFEEADCNN